MRSDRCDLALGNDVGGLGHAFALVALAAGERYVAPLACMSASA